MLGAAYTFTTQDYDSNLFLLKNVTTLTIKSLLWLSLGEKCLSTLTKHINNQKHKLTKKMLQT